MLGEAFRQLGPKLFNQLEGSFALAIYEPAKRSLTLVRDATGQRPLVFARTPDGARFGSIPSDLQLALQVDLDDLGAFLAGSAARSTTTPLRGVEQVRPGEMVVLTPGACERRYWWQPEVGPSAHDRSRDYAGEYRSHLTRAVEPWLGQGLTACQLSGGWDSGAVTGAAVSLRGTANVRAYTAVPAAPIQGEAMRHTNVDETGLASASASALGVKHQLINARADPFALARWFHEVAQSPLVSPFPLTWWNAIRDQARADGATAVLTGEMGNLSLNAGGLPALAVLIAQRRLASAWREARLLARAGTIRWRGAAAAVLSGHVPGTLLQWFGERLAGGPPARPETFLRERGTGDRRAERLPADAYEARLAMIRETESGVHRILSERHWNLIEADPTADRALIEWSLTLPPEAFLKNGELRPMARRALQGWLPDPVLNSHLRGLQSADWYQMTSAADCRHVLAEIREHQPVREFLDIAALDRAISEWPSSDWNSAAHYARFRVGVVGALCTGLFIARFSA